MATISVFGRLTGDPEVKAAQGGNITHFNLADNHGKDNNGQEKVSFFRCSAFGKVGEMLAASCKKGHRLYISGRFESRKYTDNGGVAQTSLDVTVNDFGFVEPRDQAAAPAQQAQPAAQQVGQPAYQRDQAGNYWQLINGQMVMTHNAQGQPVQRQAAPPAPAAPAAPVYPPQQYAPPAGMAAPAQQAYAPMPQGACPPSERPF